jgi:hypothetical protein
MNCKGMVAVQAFLGVLLWIPAGVQADRAVASSASAPAGNSPAQSNKWRYKYHHGRWWYWLPSNSWVFYQNQHWIPYHADPHSQARAANGGPIRRNAAYRGLATPSVDPRWPRGDNGSGPNASPEPGGADPETSRQPGLPPPGRWPRDMNGSDPNASPRPGGAAVNARGADHRLPPRGRWPRSTNGSDPNASP